LVSGDQLVVSVSDTVANYGLQLQRAKNAVSRASLQKEQTKVSLDKSLTDVEIALDVAKNNLNVSKLTTEQSLKKAELDFSSATAQSQNIYLQFDLEKDNALNVLDTILHQMDSYL
jgi:precorrin-2 methylase